MQDSNNIYAYKREGRNGPATEIAEKKKTGTFRAKKGKFSKLHGQEREKGCTYRGGRD